MSSKTELEALGLLTDLVANSGGAVKLVGRPEEDHECDLNNDFLVTIESERWGLEVMRLTLDQNWVAAKQRMLSELERRLIKFASDSMVIITSMVAPPFELGTLVKQEAWLAKTCRLIEAAILKKRPDVSIVGGDFHFQYGGTIPSVHLFPAFTTTANTQDELNGACARPLTYKLTEQLPPTSPHYESRGIILDSRSDDSKMPSFFPLSDYTVLGLIDLVQSNSEVTAVDGAWWISPEAIIQRLI